LPASPLFHSLCSSSSISPSTSPCDGRWSEGLNDRLRGYTVQIRALDFHVLGFSLDLKDAVIVQQANPDPPVARIPKLSASVQWRELLTGYVVADFLFDNPVVYVNRQHFKAEVQDEVPIEQRGWQDALQAVYPFKINQFTVVNGELIYVDEGPFRPLQLTRVNFRAENIRNIRSRHRTYPSELYLEAMVFDAGRLRLDGRADFLAEPHPGIRAGIDLEQMELDYFKPIARRYNLEVSKGTLSADGVLEYAPDIKVVHLREVSLHGLHGDFVHSRPTAAAEKQVRKEIGRAAEKVSNAPSILLRVDHARVANSTVGFVNRAANPEYRIFLADAQLDVTNLSNQFTEGTAVATLKGRFMGSGATAMKATFRPDTHGPDFDLDLRVDDTQMRAMNDLLRAYGKFDVVAGLFSFYSELSIKNGTIEGYVKPMFRDLDVYDERQDREPDNGGVEHRPAAAPAPREQRATQGVEQRHDSPDPGEDRAQRDQDLGWDGQAKRARLGTPSLRQGPGGRPPLQDLQERDNPLRRLARTYQPGGGDPCLAYDQGLLRRADRGRERAHIVARHEHGTTVR